jgi:hypothetical protein
MNKFTDEYFRNKVKEFVKRNHEEITTLQSDILYIMFKEVARDVRHACAEVRVQDYPFDTFSGGGLDDETEARMQGFDEGQDAHAKACMNL